MPREGATGTRFAPVPLLDFSREYQAIGSEVMAAVQEVFASQRYVLGPQVSAFEVEAAKACAVPSAIGCASGTDALWLALAAAGVAAGDRVITTPFSFFATASAILRTGARPVFADIDPATFNLDAACVRKVQDASSEELKAVLPVHLYGQTVDWDAIEALRTRYGCLLIEDAAQAFGAAWSGHPAGSLGDAAAFSFYPTKNLSAAGEAGMVTTSNADLAERATMLARPRHAQALLSRGSWLEQPTRHRAGSGTAGEAALHRRVEPAAPRTRCQLRPSVSQRRPGGGRAVSGKGRCTSLHASIGDPTSFTSTSSVCRSATNCAAS